MMLKIKTGPELRSFIKSIPDNVGNIPENIHQLITSSTDVLITNSDLKWIGNYMKQNPDGITYLHQLMEGCIIELPTLPLPPPRSPELENRLARLRKEQEQKQYEKMVKNVTFTSQPQTNESFAAELKVLNRQLLEVMGFVISLFAAFMFGFVGINFMIGPLDLGIRALLGVVIALIVAVAELYFLARTFGDHEFFHHQKSNIKFKSS